MLVVAVSLLIASYTFIFPFGQECNNGYYLGHLPAGEGTKTEEPSFCKFTNYVEECVFLNKSGLIKSYGMAIHPCTFDVYILSQIYTDRESLIVYEYSGNSIDIENLPTPTILVTYNVSDGTDLFFQGLTFSTCVNGVNATLYTMTGVPEDESDSTSVTTTNIYEIDYTNDGSYSLVTSSDIDNQMEDNRGLTYHSLYFNIFTIGSIDDGTYIDIPLYEVDPIGGSSTQLGTYTNTTYSNYYSMAQMFNGDLTYDYLFMVVDRDTLVRVEINDFSKEPLPINIFTYRDVVGVVCNSSIIPTNEPTLIPSLIPTNNPSLIPSLMPSNNPSVIPSNNPTIVPSLIPTNNPSLVPTIEPSNNPTVIPTNNPSVIPSKIPSNMPSLIPTIEPSNNPTVIPTLLPSNNPSVIPTNVPSIIPSNNPTNNPSSLPSNMPTMIPSVNPTNNPSVIPTNNPTNNPSINPSNMPSFIPSMIPTDAPFVTLDPTMTPSMSPSVPPSAMPSTTPTLTPTAAPSRARNSEACCHARHDTDLYEDMCNENEYINHCLKREDHVRCEWELYNQTKCSWKRGPKIFYGSKLKTNNLQECKCKSDKSERYNQYCAIYDKISECEINDSRRSVAGCYWDCTL